MLFISWVLVIAVIAGFTVTAAPPEEEDDYDCRGSHVPHPDSTHKYRMKVGPLWYEQECAPAQLIWDQDMCACVYPKPDRPTTDKCEYVAGNSPKEYRRWVGFKWEDLSCDWPAPSGLIWNPDVCGCDWPPENYAPANAAPKEKSVSLNRLRPRVENRDPDIRLQPTKSEPKEECTTIVQFSFDEQIKEDTKNVWITQKNKDNINIARDRSAVGRGAAQFKDSSLVLPFFVGNFLGSVIRVQFRFSLCEDMSSREIVFMQNGCNAAENPTIYIAYKTRERRLVVALDTAHSKSFVKTECSFHASRDGAYDEIDLIYQDNYLVLKTNGRPCIRTPEYTGPLKVTKCSMVMPDSGFCGKLDEVKFSRFCRV